MFDPLTNILLLTFKGKWCTANVIDYCDHFALAWPVTMFWRDKKGTYYARTYKDTDETDAYVRAGRRGRGFQRATAQALESTRLR